MLFTSEIPIEIMDKVKGDFPFLINTYMLKKGYKDYYKGEYGIVDNGAFELAFGINDIIANLPMPRHKNYYCVIPDCFKDPLKTQMAKIKMFTKDKCMFVPHGKTKDEYLDALCGFIGFVKSKAKAKKINKVLIGISYHEPFYSKNRFVAAIQRQHIVKAVNKLLNKIDPDGIINMHLLGAQSVFELWLCRKYNRVLSADSSLPVLQGLNGRKTGLFTKKYPQVPGFIDTANISDKTAKLIQSNINYVIKKVCK